MSEHDSTLGEEEIQGESSGVRDAGRGRHGRLRRRQRRDGHRRRLRLGRLRLRFRRLGLRLRHGRIVQKTKTHSALARCVGPVEGERFFDEYWEQKPLLVPRDEEGRFHDLLSIAEVERRVSSRRASGIPPSASSRRARSTRSATTPRTSPGRRRPSPGPRRSSGSRPSSSGARRSSSRHCTSTIRLWRASAAISSVSSAIPRRRTRTTRRRSAQGFKVHHDTHDVFCLQVAGEKRWLVYPPVLELPLSSQKYNAGDGRAGRAGPRRDDAGRRHPVSPARLAAPGDDLGRDRRCT